MKKCFLDRLSRLHEYFDQWKVEGLSLSNPIDIYYLTGLKLSQGHLFVHRKESLLCVDGRYVEMARKETSLKVLPYTKEGQWKFSTKMPWSQMRLLGFDGHTTSYDEYVKLKRQFREMRKKKGISTPLSLKSIQRPVQKLREVKEEGEIRCLRESARLLWKGFQWIKKQLKPGIRECDLAYQFESYCRKMGAESLSFPPIIAFGSNSAFPHYHTGKCRLKRNEMILCDIGVYVKGYASDMTRMLFYGEVSEEVKQLYKVVREAHRAVLEQCRPGVEIGSLDARAREVMRQAGMETLFLHGLGHGVGLEIHESPRLSREPNREKLQSGMVFTVEPGLYLPGKGGVRYEDMVVITEEDHQNFFPESSPYL